MIDNKEAWGLKNILLLILILFFIGFVFLIGCNKHQGPEPITDLIEDRGCVATLEAIATTTAIAVATATAVKEVEIIATATEVAITSPPPAPVNLDIHISVTGENPQIGSEIYYEIRIYNGGERPVTNLSVWDTLPAELVFDTNNFAVAPSVVGNYINWNLSSYTLNPAEEIIIRFTARLVAFYATIIINVAFVDYNDPFFTPGYGRHPPVYSNLILFPSGFLL